MSFVIDLAGASEYPSTFINVIRYHKRVCVCVSVIRMLSDKGEGGLEIWGKYLDFARLCPGPLDTGSTKKNFQNLKVAKVFFWRKSFI